MRSTSPRILSRAAEYGFLLPALFLVGVLLIGSIIMTIGISFTEWNLIGVPESAEFAQYERVFRDPSIRTSLLNTIFWVIGSLALPVLGGLLVAGFINSLPGKEFWKTVIYVPVVLAPTVTALAWKEMLSLEGPFNGLLGGLGLNALQRGWLVEAPLNTFVMVVTSTWRTIGPAMVLFLVGLQNIPRETAEAASVDGAGPWTTFWRIKLPQMKPIVVVVTTMAVVNSFTTFDYVWVMTQGGPYQSSETLAVTIYRLAFGEWRVGYASALAVVLSAITILLSVVYIYRSVKPENRRH